MCWFYITRFKRRGNLIISELRRGDGQLESSRCQNESSHQQSPEGHLGAQEQPDVRRQHLAQATQRLPYLSGGSDRRCQEPAGVARQVTEKMAVIIIMMCWASVKVPAHLCHHFHLNTAQPDVWFLYIVLTAGIFRSSAFKNVCVLVRRV